MTSMDSLRPDLRRETFLNMVAEKLGRPRRRPSDVVHPDFGPHPAEPYPEQGIDVAEPPHPSGEPKQSEDLVEQFIRVFESQKGFAVRAKGAEGVHQALADIVKGSRVNKAVFWDDEWNDQFGVLDSLASQGVAAHRWPGGEGGARGASGDGSEDGVPIPTDRADWTNLAESCQIGITWADGVCAETGTILLQNYGGHGRLVSLLPRHHVVMFNAGQIVPRLTGLMSELHRLAETNALPAYTNFIAGPSGSADIAMEYIQGVHGPGTVTAIIVEEDV